MSTDILDQLAVDAQVGAPPGGHSISPRQAIQKLRYSHEALIDLMIAQPEMSQNDLAARFGYSASWISQVISSDIFQGKLMERVTEIVDPTLTATVEQRLKGQVLRSMELLREKLDRPAAEVPDNLVLRTLEISSRALGYGAKDTQVNVQVNVEGHLEQLGGRLTELLNRKKIESTQPILEQL
jgi:hypothetical protein